PRLFQGTLQHGLVSLGFGGSWRNFPDRRKAYGTRFAIMERLSQMSDFVFFAILFKCTERHLFVLLGQRHGFSLPLELLFCRECSIARLCGVLHSASLFPHHFL